RWSAVTVCEDTVTVDQDWSSWTDPPLGLLDGPVEEILSYWASGPVQNTIQVPFQTKLAPTLQIAK
ncbi:hypothetical protein A2U01_0101780, partial [Trifolium medium]|nr:hypothetical protein [Trifolium medium]